MSNYKIPLGAVIITLIFFMLGKIAGETFTHFQVFTTYGVWVIAGELSVINDKLKNKQ